MRIVFRTGKLAKFHNLAQHDVSFTKKIIDTTGEFSYLCHDKASVNLKIDLGENSDNILCSLN